ncbi:MAG: amino acid adenylation domain-containing protein, partial [bacterium]|nr:amino acid adenylation domain-containing protein [bacterium]
IFEINDPDFDPSRFEKAFSLLVGKHEILRTTFNHDDFDQPVQLVHKSLALDIRHEDISRMEKTLQKEHLSRFLQRDSGDFFDLTSLKPLWRIRTFALGGGNICIIWTAHHAIVDGWSNASLVTELNNTYRELESRPGFVPVKLKSSYKEFVVREMVEKKNKTSIEYWKHELSGYKRLVFPAPVTMESVDNGDGSYQQSLGGDLLEKLKSTAKKYRSSMKNLCFAAFVYMLHMIAYEDDIVVGYVTNCRPQCSDGDRILGCFLNTVPARIRIPVNIRREDYLRLVDKKMLELKRYERMPLQEIVNIVGENSSEENPFFDTLFNFVDFHVYRNLSGESVSRDTGLHLEGNDRINTSFNFNVSATLGDFSLSVSYSGTGIDTALVTKMCGYFETFLNKCSGEPDEIIGKEGLMTEREKQELLVTFNDTGAHYPANKTIYELFARQVEERGDNTALVGPAGGEDEIPGSSFFLTYRQLAEQALLLAGRLKQKGAVPGAIVGIMMERSIEMVVGIFGILCAGAAYLPIDPTYPPERIRFILEDSAVEWLLTSVSTTSISKPGGCEVINPGLPGSVDAGPGNAKAADIAPLELTEPTRPAYVIYTSGSTGRPKGVLVEQRSVVNLLLGLQKMYPLTAADTYLLKTFYGFDVSVTELFGWFPGGGRLAILDRGGEKDPGRIVETIHREGITHINFAPSMFNVFVDLTAPAHTCKLSGLKYIFLAGEALSPDLVTKFKRLNTGIILENLYGPTEGTVYGSRYSLTHWNNGSCVPIGKPFHNITLCIVDKNENLQPAGVAGELCIGGPGKARGYLNNPELTAEKFRTLQGIPVYKTGDLARWLPDGNIQFLGRLDHQVKIRGFRVEPGEIQNRILEHENIFDAVVVELENEHKENFLCAYIVTNHGKFPLQPGEEAVDETALKNYLAGRLPAYMVPSAFVYLDQLPLTPSGKVDRINLKHPDRKTGSAIVPARSPMEKKLLEIWAKVLGIENNAIGIDDDFFQLGGHSLRATILISRIHRHFQVRIPHAQLFKAATVREMASYIKEAAPDRLTLIERTGEKEYFPLSSVQRRLYTSLQMLPPSTLYNIPLVVVLEGDIQKKKVERIFKHLLQRHESLRTAFILLDGHPVQKIEPDPTFTVEYHDITDGHGVVNESDSSPAVTGIINNFVRPFDLSRAPLMRAGLIKTGPNSHVLMTDFHHIIADGISLGIFAKDFMDYYLL